MKAEGKSEKNINLILVIQKTFKYFGSSFV